MSTQYHLTRLQERIHYARQRIKRGEMTPYMAGYTACWLGDIALDVGTLGAAATVIRFIDSTLMPGVVSATDYEACRRWA